MSSLPPPPPRQPWDRAALPPPPDAWEQPDGWDALRAVPAEERRPRWLAPLGIGISMVLLGGVVAGTWRAVDDGPGHPDAWDPRVADLAAYVEDERGLDFEHPVYVDFLSADEYTKEATGADAGADEEAARADFGDYAQQLRALGVASGELDLFEAFNSVVDGGTLAFYDPDDERVRVRGKEMSVGLEVTLVHELTHALQDQHFDLDRVYDPTLDSGESTAFRSLAEGDALRVENAYVEEELTDDEQADYDEEFAGDLADSESATADVPPFMEALFGAPYALGQPFVTMLYNKDGNDGVDDAFEDPPTTDEHVLDPASFLDDEGAEDVDLDLDAELDVLEQGPFGATSWYLVLAERIDPKQAFEAALGWNGDAFAAYETDDDDVCVQAVFAGDAESDEDEMSAAIDDWASAMPSGSAEAIEVHGHPGMKTCDPGESVDLELTGRSETSLYLPNLWGYLIADAASVLDAEGSRCYARTVVDGLTYEQITDPEGATFAGDAFQARLQDAYETCSG
ncbi:MAG: hypothetical protein ACJ739_08895 [Acidimicrobiales bacterium]